MVELAAVNDPLVQLPTMDTGIQDLASNLAHQAATLRHESRRRLFRDISMTQALFGPIFFIMFVVVLQVRLPIAIYFVVWMTLSGLLGFCYAKFLMPKSFMSHYPSGPVPASHLRRSLLGPFLFIASLMCGIMLGLATVVSGTLHLTHPGSTARRHSGEDQEEDMGVGPAIGIGALMTCLEVAALVLVVRDFLGCTRYGLTSELRPRNNRVAPAPRTQYQIVISPAMPSIRIPFVKQDNPPDYAHVPPPTYEEATDPSEPTST